MTRRIATAWFCLCQIGAVIALGAGAVGIKHQVLWIFGLVWWEVLVIATFVYHQVRVGP